MDDRLVVHNKLADLYPELNLYFRPPSKLIINYPCAVYDVNGHKALRANNTAYAMGTKYRVTIMSQLPGLENVRRMLELPGTSFVTSYISKDIAHEVFDINAQSL